MGFSLCLYIVGDEGKSRPTMTVSVEVGRDLAVGPAIDWADGLDIKFAPLVHLYLHLRPGLRLKPKYRWTLQMTF